MATLDLADRVITAELLRQCFMKAAGSPEPPPPLTPEGYIIALCRAYHVASATTPTMLRAAEHFREIGETAAAALSENKAAEEFGHEALALKDLSALGLHHSVVAGIHPESARAIVAVFERAAAQPRPFGVFGYAYALEYGMSLVTKDYLRAVQRMVSPGIDITRALRIHVGIDHQHADEIASLVATLNHADRLAVMQAIQDTVPLLVSAVHDRGCDDALKTILTETQWSVPEAA